MLQVSFHPNMGFSRSSWVDGFYFQNFNVSCVFKIAFDMNFKFVFKIINGVVSCCKIRVSDGIISFLGVFNIYFSKIYVFVQYPFQTRSFAGELQAFRIWKRPFQCVYRVVLSFCVIEFACLQLDYIYGSQHSTAKEKKVVYPKFLGRSGWKIRNLKIG